MPCSTFIAPRRENIFFENCSCNKAPISLTFTRLVLHYSSGNVKIWQKSLTISTFNEIAICFVLQLLYKDIKMQNSSPILYLISDLNQIWRNFLKPWHFSEISFNILISDITFHFVLLHKLLWESNLSKNSLLRTKDENDEKQEEFFPYFKGTLQNLRIKYFIMSTFIT